MLRISSVLMLLLALFSVSHAQQPENEALLVDWHPSGEMIAYNYRSGHEIFIVNAETHEILNHLQGLGLQTESPKWSPDGQYLAFISDLDIVEVWENAWDPELAGRTYHLDMNHQLEGPNHTPISKFSWHPSSQRLVFGGDIRIAIWQFLNDEFYIFPYLGHWKQIHDLAWYDEDSLILGDTSPKSAIINAETGNVEATFYVRDSYSLNSVSALALNPDGSRVALVSSTNILYIWDPSQGEIHPDFVNNSGRVAQAAERSAFVSEDYMYSVDWNATGEYIAIADQGGKVRIFDAETLTLIQEYDQGMSVVSDNSVAWSPDGTKLAFGTIAMGLQIVDGPPVTQVTEGE